MLRIPNTPGVGNLATCFRNLVQEAVIPAEAAAEKRGSELADNRMEIAAAYQAEG